MTAGDSATLTGAAEPGTTVELWAYSRPSTSYRLVRSTTAAASGLYAFSVTPPTDTRLRSRVDGLDSGSVVVGVRHLVRTSATRTGCGPSASPGPSSRSGPASRVDVLARTGGGLRLLTTARTGADGRWSVDRTFHRPATWDVVARTAADGVNRSGTRRPRARGGALSGWHAARVIVGVGIDVVQVERLERALARTPRLAMRLFTDGERARPAPSRWPRGSPPRRPSPRRSARRAGCAGPTPRWSATRAAGRGCVLHGGVAAEAAAQGITHLAPVAVARRRRGDGGRGGRGAGGA